MIDPSFWQQLASKWVSIYSAKDEQQNESVAAGLIFSIGSHQKEKDLRDELLGNWDDDDVY